MFKITWSWEPGPCKQHAVRSSSSHLGNLREGQTSSGSLPKLSEKLLSTSVLDIESSSLAERHSAGRAKGCRKSVVIWQGAKIPTWVPGLWGVTPRLPQKAGGCSSDHHNICIRHSGRPENGLLHKSRHVCTNHH